MKKLEKLKLHNLEEICVEEQRSLRGGTGDGIPPGMIGDVDVYGKKPDNFQDRYYLYGGGDGGSVFDGANGFSSGGGFLANYHYDPDRGPDQIWDAFRGWAGSDVPMDNNSNIQGGNGSLGFSQYALRAQKSVDLARNYMCIEEVAGIKDNLQIMEFFACTTLNAPHDETAWCSAFVNYIMANSGRAITNSALASSWSTWGSATLTPHIGDVAVRSDGHHVGIVSEIDAN